MKIIQTGGKKDIPSFTIEDYDVYKHENVVDVRIHHRLFDPTFDFGWDLSLQDNKNELDTSSFEEYFYCDTLFEGTFGHWVHESGLYAPLFLALKKIHPSLKWFSSKKKYKEVMFRAFGLSENDFCYEIKTYNNVFYFPRYTSHHDLTLDTNYKNKLKKSHALLKSIVGPIEKTIDYLYLPRGSKENYKENDRSISCQNELIKHFLEKPNAKVFFTDEVNTYVDQMKCILSAKTIVVDYGANLFVNGFFSENARIICIGHDIHHQIQSGVSMVFECIKEHGNTVEFIHKISQDNSTPPKQIFSLEEIYSKLYQ